MNTSGVSLCFHVFFPTTPWFQMKRLSPHQDLLRVRVRNVGMCSIPSEINGAASQPRSDAEPVRLFHPSSRKVGLQLDMSSGNPCQDQPPSWRIALDKRRSRQRQCARNIWVPCCAWICYSLTLWWNRSDYIQIQIMEQYGSRVQSFKGLLAPSNFGCSENCLSGTVDPGSWCSCYSFSLSTLMRRASGDTPNLSKFAKFMA